MARDPVERLSQHQLALELRTAIDTAIRDEGLTRSLDGAERRAAKARLTTDYMRIVALVVTHPIGLHSKHVEHNLGVGRLRWLHQFQIRD